MIIDGHRHIEAGHELILEQMDELGIDRTVLVGVGVRDLGVVKVRDSAVFRSHLLLRTLGVWRARRLVRSRRLRDALLGEPVNDRVLDAMSVCPGRFTGFVFVNPESDRALSEIGRCLRAGMHGIKLALLQYPTDLAGPRMLNICSVAEKWRVPIFFHQGLTPAASDASGMIDAFPGVDFIIAHAGVQYFDEAIATARGKENVFVDTSSCIVTVAKLKRLLRELGSSKLIFGTDVPVMGRHPREALAKIERLSLSGRDRELVLGENLRMLLGLPA